MKRCPITHCIEVIDQEKVFCLKHWMAVPRALQGAIYKCFRNSRGSREHLAAIQSATDAVNKLVEEAETEEDKEP